MRIGVWKAIAGGRMAVAVVLDDEIISSGIGIRVFLAIHVRYVRKSFKNDRTGRELTLPPISSGYRLHLHRHHPNHLEPIA